MPEDSGDRAAPFYAAATMRFSCVFLLLLPSGSYIASGGARFKKNIFINDVMPKPHVHRAGAGEQDPSTSKNTLLTMLGHLEHRTAAV